MGVGGLSGWLVAAGCCCFRLIGLRRVGCFGVFVWWLFYCDAGLVLLDCLGSLFACV